MAKKQSRAKAPERNRRRGGGVGSYILTIFVSTIVTTLLIAVLVVATASMRTRGGASASTIGQANNDNNGGATEEPTPEATATPARTGVIASGSNQAVNVRSGAGTNFDVVGTVDSGATVVILGQNSEGTWQNIQLADGTQGWVSTALMRLPQEPTPTPQSAEVTQSVEATEVVVVECEGSEARDWWASSGESLYAQSKLAVLRAAANQLNNINDLYVSVQSDLATFEQAEYPPCVASLRTNLMSGAQEVMAGLQDYANGSLEGGRGRVANAQTGLFDPVLQSLSADLGVTVFSGDCAVDAWFAGIEETYTRYTTIVREFAPGTTPLDQVRPLIFETQRLRQTVADSFAPDCAVTVRDLLLDTMDAAIGMLQGAFAGDQGAVQSNQATLVAARDAFQSEMRRLGYPV